MVSQKYRENIHFRFIIIVKYGESSAVIVLMFSMDEKKSKKFRKMAEASGKSVLLHR